MFDGLNLQLFPMAVPVDSVFYAVLVIPGYHLPDSDFAVARLPVLEHRLWLSTRKISRGGPTATETSFPGLFCLSIRNSTFHSSRSGHFYGGERIKDSDDPWSNQLPPCAVLDALRRPSQQFAARFRLGRTLEDRSPKRIY